MLRRRVFSLITATKLLFHYLIINKSISQMNGLLKNLFCKPERESYINKIKNQRINTNLRLKQMGNCNGFQTNGSTINNGDFQIDDICKLQELKTLALTYRHRCRLL